MYTSTKQTIFLCFAAIPLCTMPFYYDKLPLQAISDYCSLLSIQSEVFGIPTVSKLLELHNNYVLQSAENEHVTAMEKTEENNLLDDLLATNVMQYARNFLIQKGTVK